jgi:hypothetical protein
MKKIKAKNQAASQLAKLRWAKETPDPAHFAEIGRKGAAARNAKLSRERRIEIAHKAAAASAIARRRKTPKKRL